MKIAVLLFGCALGCTPARAPEYEGLVQRAERHVARGDLAGAERDFARAHELDAEGLEARYGLAFVKGRRCLADKRVCQACLAAFDAIVAEADYRSAYYNRAQCAFELGRRKQALADLDHAVATRPDDLDYRMTRALMRLHVGRTREACADLEKARTLGADVKQLLDQRCR